MIANAHIVLHVTDDLTSFIFIYSPQKFYEIDFHYSPFAVEETCDFPNVTLPNNEEKKDHSN